LFFKLFFIQKCIKIKFFIFKKLFLLSTYQNNLKTPKNINLKQIKKLKNINFFKNVFETQTQTRLKKRLGPLLAHIRGPTWSSFILTGT